MSDSIVELLTKSIKSLNVAIEKRPDLQGYLSYYVYKLEDIKKVYKKESKNKKSALAIDREKAKKEKADTDYKIKMEERVKKIREARIAKNDQIQETRRRNKELATALEADRIKKENSNFISQMSEKNTFNNFEIEVYRHCTRR